MSAAPHVLARFLAPRHAVADVDIDQWHGDALAETPGANARCRIFLACDDAGRLAAAFSAFGPPVTIAAADWLCERVGGLTIPTARAISVADVEQALSLPADARYAGLLVLDAFGDALADLSARRLASDLPNLGR